MVLEIIDVKAYYCCRSSLISGFNNFFCVIPIHICGSFRYALLDHSAGELSNNKKKDGRTEERRKIGAKNWKSLRKNC